jgi:hypothetical protein
MCWGIALCSEVAEEILGGFWKLGRAISLISSYLARRKLTHPGNQHMIE